MYYTELIRLAFILVFSAIGYSLHSAFSEWLAPYYSGIWGSVLLILIFAGVGFLLGGIVGKKAKETARGVEEALQEIPGIDFLFAVSGLLVGLIVASLISFPFLLSIPKYGAYLSFFFFFFLGVLGVYLGWQKRGEFLSVVGGSPVRAIYILDTSAIIDGRISKVFELGFLSGKLVVPDFVVREVQSLADSDDFIRRSKGKRGLEILGEMKEKGILMVEKEEVEGGSVDEKLVDLAEKRRGKLITTDYNLSKVANLKGVPTLNLNDLANALKPSFVPGEKMLIKVIREGKEEGQGVGYLDDGTMVVVEGGKSFIGKEVEVEVSSLLQTSSGKIIFTHPVNN
jgi:uncharacterized protein YacL